MENTKAALQSRRSFPVKRTVALLLVLLLALPISAWARTLNCRDLFSIEYPTFWTDYGADSSEDVENEYYELGFIGGRLASSLYIVLYAYYLPEYADLRLFEADQATISAVADELMAEYGETRLIEIQHVSEYEIPFIIFECDYGYGDELMALTVSNGWMIMLNGYAFKGMSDDLRDLTQDDTDSFLSVVSSFTPILK